MRPQSLDEIVGQEHVLGPDASFRRGLSSGLRSVLLYGPPGCGKTTLARLLAQGRELVTLSAVLAGKKELMEVVQRARTPGLLGRDIVLFVDEIHRWNRAQQDALLPHVEDGTLTLVGATTENPGFQIRRTLLSRMELVTLRALSEDDLVVLMQRALQSERGLDGSVSATEAGLRVIARVAGGDGRCALGLLERVADTGVISEQTVAERLDRDAASLSLDSDEHFALASALVKSMRGSDPDAALYYLARMLEAGEDPMFIARRLVIFASEDVGNADPRGLILASSAAQAVHLIGMPEARLVLAHAATYLATAPKSNASYLGLQRALKEVRRTGKRPVPHHLRNAATDLDRDAGIGKGYRYPHDAEYGVVDQQHLPEGIEGGYYEPRPWGNERLIAERLAWWRQKLAER